MTNLRKIAKNINTAKEFRGCLRFEEQMSDHTSFKIGGAAEVFIEPDDQESLLFVLHTLNKKNIPFFVIGGGSNLLVSDKGIKGFIISTLKLNNIKIIEPENQGAKKKSSEFEPADILLSCSSGSIIADISSFCIKNGLSGFENFAGLPGSIGGAVYMNARCYEKSISDILECADYVRAAETDKSAVIKNYSMNQQDWNYKKSPFQYKAGLLILSAVFRLTRDEPAAIEARCRHCIEDREQKGHFRYPSAGSVFKNNRLFGKPTGQIIDEAGLKGLRIGNAQIAPWHGNLIVNLGGAFSDDVKELVNQVKKKVKQDTGFNLECEIIFCGE